MTTDTIAAVSTAFGEAAISVLRLSGPGAITIAAKVFSGHAPVATLPPRTAHFGRVIDAEGRTVDSVLLTLFRAPASYTGEDLVEISCHGGILVTRCIFELLLSSGARAAEPREFTQRAFLNGKMDLTQAEAVMDLIHAQSDLALQAASQQLSGRLGSAAEKLRADLIALLAHLEAHIDFPEEDIDPDTGSAFVARMESLQAQLRSLLDTAEHGRILRSGARTVICGAPNVGKSSLLNLLTGFERAIVSPQAGTTRDTIEEVLHIHGLPFVLVDTAGLRGHTSDFLEAHGMERTRRELDQADVILEVVDASQPSSEAHRVPVPQGKKGHLLVLNKADLGLHPSWSAVPRWSAGFSLSESEASGQAGPSSETSPAPQHRESRIPHPASRILDPASRIPLSTTTGTGVEALRSAMRDAIWRGVDSSSSHLVAINARHQSCFLRAADALAAAQAAMAQWAAPEFVALDVREALHHVGEVTGRVDVEEILGAIFSQFCIGK
jgi:tRNA modification GTPase